MSVERTVSAFIVQTVSAFIVQTVSAFIVQTVSAFIVQTSAAEFHFIFQTVVFWSNLPFLHNDSSEFIINP